MADEKQYEYGMTPEQTGDGLLSFLSLIRSPVRDILTPVRREVLKAPETKFTKADGYVYENLIPGEYGDPEYALEHMPIVQGIKGAYDFIGDFLSDSDVRKKTGKALSEGIGRLFDDYYRSAGFATQHGGETRFFDPKQNRVVSLDPLLPLELGIAAGLVAPVKGGGSIAGMFVGRNSATADLNKLEVAEEMAAKGHSREEIYDQTDWFRYKDKTGKPIGPWKQELSDEDVKTITNKTFLTKTSRLRYDENPTVGDLLVHQKLSEAYPGSKTALAAIQAEKIKLQEMDKDVLRKYADGEITEKDLKIERAEILAAYNQIQTNVGKQTTPGFQGPLDRAIMDIGFRKFEGKGLGADYERRTDTIATKRLPGQKFSLEHESPEVIHELRRQGKLAKKKVWVSGIPWDKKGEYVQPFLSDAARKNHLNKTEKYLADAGFVLERHGPASKWNRWKEELTPEFLDSRKVYLSADGDVYGLEKLRPDLFTMDLRAPRTELITPEKAFKDRRDLQILWDELLLGGKKFYKKDFEPSEAFKSGVLHELSHAISSREPGFDPGSNPKSFGKKYPYVHKDRVTGKKLSAREIYERTLGEAEARNVEYRKDFTSAERKERPPWTTLDVPESSLLTQQNLYPEGKAHGGFVDKPLYEDARMID